jgi:hypothetical protein
MEKDAANSASIRKSTSIDERGRPKISMIQKLVTYGAPFTSSAISIFDDPCSQFTGFALHLQLLLLE